MDRNTGFAQYGLRNAVQLVRIGPSLGMAEFISNSAIGPSSHRQVRSCRGAQLWPGDKKWQTSSGSPPLLNYRRWLRS